ncbi:MAG: carboxymuconolactone decarboxylase family protein [Tidjanibacter sp.]|nr:carboxymuconolactone decarboxylase family protein [Tidjanibacter sp.]
MKLLAIFAVAALLPAQPNAQNNNMELTPKQQSLAAIAAFEVKGDIEKLAEALDEGFDNALSTEQIKEALTQLYAYTGFPRALNALGVLRNVVTERSEKGLKVVDGTAFTLPEEFRSLQKGTEVQTRLCDGQPFEYQFAPRIDYYLKAHLFGDVFASDVLTPAEREIVTLGALSALEGCGSQLVAHVSGALNMGVTVAELNSLPGLLQRRVGAMESFRLRRAIAAVEGKPFTEGEPVDFDLWPKGEPNTAYAQYFVGNSYLASMNAEDGGPVNVTFEPACRNNWHIHYNSVQVLVCVAGRGWYCQQGQDPIEMTTGKVIAIPAEVKHWHGAARDSWFQHLTYTTRVGEGASTEWLEEVSSAQYNSLK